MSLPTWLPELVLNEDSGKEWRVYEEALYKVFKKDFVNGQPKLEGKGVWHRKDPMTNNKPLTFWHIITKDKDKTSMGEDERCPEFRRCERIGWIRPIIEHIGKTPDVILWKEAGNKGKKLTNTCILFSSEEETYLVVLRESTRYFILWTAYPITESHQKRKILKRYEEYQKMKTATF
jgi:hypothetical protein